MDTNTDSQQEPTFRDLVNLIRRGLVFALAVGIGAAVLTYLLTKRMPATYQATATVLASQPDSALQKFGVSLVTAPAVDATAYQAAATSSPVIGAAIESLGGTKPSEQEIESLRKEVSVQVDSSQQSSLLHIEVKNGSPSSASNTANALANALLSWDKQRATQNLHEIVLALQSQIASLDAQIAQARSAASSDPGQVTGLQNLRAQQSLQLNSARALENSAVGTLEILEPAVVPITPLAPRPARDAGLAFVLGILIVYALVLLRDALDTRFRGTEDLTRATGLPVLAEFPRMVNGSRHLPREASNYLRTNILFASNDDDPKVVVVTSAGSAEGKTSVAMSLAESFARNDYRTLLVDADLRKPRIADEYSISAFRFSPLRHLLEDPTMQYEPAVVPLDNGELHIVPTFLAAPGPSELLGRGFSKVVQRFSHQYDVIIVDSAPVLPVADALTIVPHGTGVVFSVSLPTVDRSRARAALALLERIGVRVLGLVATNLEGSAKSKSEYRSGYGYGYGSSHDGDRDHTGDLSVLEPTMARKRRRADSSGRVRSVK